MAEVPCTSGALGFEKNEKIEIRITSEDIGITEKSKIFLPLFDVVGSVPDSCGELP